MTDALEIMIAKVNRIVATRIKQREALEIMIAKVNEILAKRR